MGPRPPVTGWDAALSFIITMLKLTDHSLLQHNTFGINVRCARYVELESVEEACHFFPADFQPVFVIGGGSNLLFTNDYPGTIVRSAIRGITVSTQTDGKGGSEPDILVRAGSGEAWDHLVDYCTAHDWHGLENLSLIPGDVGASAVQNIGAYGSEAADTIVSVEAVDTATGKTVIIPAADCGYGYRQSRFKTDWRARYFITHVTYRLSAHFQPRLDYGNLRAVLRQRSIGDQPTASQLRQAVIDIRREKLPDPEVTGNAGSFFMNPIVSRQHYERLAAKYPQMPSYPVGGRASGSDNDEGQVKLAAGWLIDQCGWKGRTLGPAGVHDRQALVLVNRGGATGDDILALCRAIQHDVRERFDIELKPEVLIV